MTKHEHNYKLAFKSTYGEKVEYVYLCETCNHRKTTKEAPEIKRLSNMGGEFSTNWRSE